MAGAKLSVADDDHPLIPRVEVVLMAVTAAVVAVHDDAAATAATVVHPGDLCVWRAFITRANIISSGRFAWPFKPLMCAYPCRPLGVSG